MLRTFLSDRQGQLSGLPLEEVRTIRDEIADRVRAVMEELDISAHA